MLKQLSAVGRLVVSTGAGTVAKSENWYEFYFIWVEVSDFKVLSWIYASEIQEAHCSTHLPLQLMSELTVIVDCWLILSGLSRNMFWKSTHSEIWKFTHSCVIPFGWRRSSSLISTRCLQGFLETWYSYLDWHAGGDCSQGCKDSASASSQLCRWWGTGTHNKITDLSCMGSLQGYKDLIGLL